MVAFVYSAAQEELRRMRHDVAHASFLDIAGDQVKCREYCYHTIFDAATELCGD